jgi:acyl-CoA reductase-like NAD-dependent aldehyde dehydrogenase
MTEPIRERALYIDGTWTPGNGSDLEVENPATEEITGVVTQGNAWDVDEAIAAARAAFPGWAATSIGERVQALRRLREAVSSRAETFATLIVQRYLTPERAGDARLVSGGPDGRSPERGYYVTPTAYSDVAHDAPLAQEEIFGPVLSVLSAESDDSIYGSAAPCGPRTPSMHWSTPHASRPGRST